MLPDLISHHLPKALAASQVEDLLGAPDFAYHPVPDAVGGRGGLSYIYSVAGTKSTKEGEVTPTALALQFDKADKLVLAEVVVSPRDAAAFVDP
jgi:hypothetical protein